MIVIQTIINYSCNFITFVFLRTILNIPKYHQYTQILVWLLGARNDDYEFYINYEPNNWNWVDKVDWMSKCSPSKKSFLLINDHFQVI